MTSSSFWDKPGSQPCHRVSGRVGQGAGLHNLQEKEPGARGVRTRGDF